MSRNAQFWRGTRMMNGAVWVSWPVHMACPYGTTDVNRVLAKQKYGAVLGGQDQVI